MIPDRYRCLVLNADYVPLTTVSWKKAIRRVMEEHAALVDFYRHLKAHDGKGRAHPVPAVIANNRYVRVSYNQAPFNRKNVLIRDGNTCQYCGRRCEPRDLTFDHVVPRSKWPGPDTPTQWTNIVAACAACNARKANRTCAEANMHPLHPPRVPPYGSMFVGMSPYRDRTPEEWLPYLTALPAAAAVYP